MKINSDLLRQWTNLIAIIAAFVTNILANIVPIQGLSIGEISQTFFADVLIIPANYAFAIWGLIYLGLISLGIYQFLPSQKEDPQSRQIGYFLAISSIAQIFWVIVFQLRWFVLSAIVMLIILLPLIFLYLRVENLTSQKKKWFIKIPVSIYLAWISVATIVNIALALNFIGWQGWRLTPIVWTIIMMIIATVLALIISWQKKDIAYGGVLIWSLMAIAIRHLDKLMIATSAILLMMILVFSIIYNYRKS